MPRRPSAGLGFAYQEALQLAEQIDEPQLLFPATMVWLTLYLDAGRACSRPRPTWPRHRRVCERAGLEPDALMVLPFLWLNLPEGALDMTSMR